MLNNHSDIEAYLDAESGIGTFRSLRQRNCSAPGRKRISPAKIFGRENRKQKGQKFNPPDKGHLILGSLKVGSATLKGGQKSCRCKNRNR